MVLTRADIVERLQLQDARIFVSSFDRPNIRYRVVQKDNPRRQLLDFLSAHRGEAGIVYCLSRKKVEEPAAMLNLHGVTALPYHAGMDATTRAANQRNLYEFGNALAVGAGRATHKRRVEKHDVKALTLDRRE